MSTTQQRQGAQKAAAGKVRTKKSEFQQQLKTLLGQAEGLRPEYKGPAADAFFMLVGNWLEDAESIVSRHGALRREPRQPGEHGQPAQDQSAASFSKAATRLSTSVK